MSDLGDFLELAHTARSRWNTVRMQATGSVDPALVMRAAERAQPAFVPKRSRPPGDPDEARVSTGASRGGRATLWAAGRSRIRAETKSSHDGDEQTMLYVRAGDVEWIRDATGTVTVSDGDNRIFAGVHDAKGWVRLLAPDKLIAGHEVITVVRGNVAGRPTLRGELKAEANRMMTTMSGRGQIRFVGIRGDTATVELDATTGVALRYVTYLDGQAISEMEVSEVVFDETIDDTLFNERPPADAPRQDAVLFPKPVTEVASEVDFVVLVPNEGDFSGLTLPRREGRPVVVQLHRLPTGPMRMSGPPSIVQLIETTDPASVPAIAEWTPVELGDGPGWVWEPQEGGEVHVRLERHGTHVWLRGLHDRAESVALAGTLQPVPRPN